MTALPEWIRPIVGSNHEEKLTKALAIAWEALANMGCDCYPQSISGSHTSKCNFAQAKDAMCRITELGEGII